MAAALFLIVARADDGTIGDAGGNILEVQHNRIFSHTQAKETDLEVVIEARDPSHLETIVGALSARGFRVRLLDADEPEN